MSSLPSALESSKCGTNRLPITPTAYPATTEKKNWEEQHISTNRKQGM
jgi:hypothetical protein